MSRMSHYPFVLSDATSTVNERPSPSVKQYHGTRYKSTADFSTPTARRVRPVSTPGSNSAARGIDSPTGGATSALRSNSRLSGAAVVSSTPNVNLIGGFQYKPSPQRLFYQKYLLRELEPHEEHPTLTIVFDLDETLVSNRRADLPEAILRPYCIDALHAIRRLPNVEIVLWTASTEETGGPVVQQLERHGGIFDQVIFRNDSWFTEPYHTKDLRLLGRNMDRVIIFDNAPNCIKLNRFNAVLVEDFHGHHDPTDHTLLNLHALLETLTKVVSSEQSSVTDALRRYGEECTNGCRTVVYSLPESWANAPLKDLSPIMIPAQGRFIKIGRSQMA